MDAHKAQQLALDLMRQHGLLDAGWEFAWSRGKRQLGCAQVRRRRDRWTGDKVEAKSIKLSRHLVALNGEEAVRETMLHEIAHALAGIRNGHNATWKRVCRQIGAKPQRLAGEEIAVVEPRYTVVCGRCERHLDKRHRRPNRQRLQRGYCNYCGPASKGMLRLEDRAVVESKR